MKAIYRVLMPAIFLSASAVASAAQARLDVARIEQATGLHGTFNQDEGVFKVTLPRTDIRPTVGGVKLVPDQGLGAWMAFTQSDGHVMAMGDIVLLENEVNPVMTAALDAGVHVTALHNHFSWDIPRVMFMHVEAVGDEDSVARGAGRVFEALREVMRNPPSAPSFGTAAAAGSLNGEAIAAALGQRGSMSKGVYKVTIGRKASMDGMPIGKEMGVNTWAAFAGDDQHAVVDGDIAMHEDEVQDVLKALRAGGINVVAIHNHMIGESPRFVFLHYWGMGPAADLAHTLRNAFDRQHG
ncbi:MAG TPA: DUF1259 domain-containing protein [Burkholderiales bacterium]|nr:DUF1259 domain-containing protein [Burkholderiales bacterium]